MSTLPSAGNETPKRVVTAQYLGRLREQGTFSPTKPKGTSNKDQTSAYLRKYCIPELLEDLTSDLAVNQPDDPRRHLHKRLGLMLGAEAAGEPPEDVSCFLRVHIECSTRHTDGAVAHFLRRSTLDAGTSSMVKGWMEEATGLLEGLVHEALGEPFVVGDGQFETQVEAESPGMSLEDAQIQIDDLKERLRMANATIDAMAQASRAEQEDSSPRGRKPASQVATMRAVPAITNSLQSMQFEPFLADTSWDNKKDPEGSCTFRIISVNDVYELENLPFLDGVIQVHGKENTVTMLPGDFVAPSLLSSLDKGKGMIDMLNRVGGTGIQYVCFGNHETDIPIDDLRQRIGEYKGKWINSNMPGWEEPKLPEYDIIEIESGGQKRKIGIIGVCTIDPNLYRAGAFGGAMATATPVCETAARLKKMLVEEHGCDLVIPMTHQVMAEDREMARLKMGFPVLIGGHDHDPYVEQVEGSWIVKTGCDATSAAIIDIVWPSASTPGEEPEVSVELIPVSDYAASVEMEEIVHSHMRCVHEMEAAFLCALTPGIQLLSTGMRRGPTSVGTLISSLVRDGFRDSLGSVDACDGVMMDAGAIRRNYTYPENYDSFTYGDLKKEVPFDSEMVVVSIPGSVICDAIKASRERAYKEPPEDWGGYMQLDDGFKWDSDTNTVTHINHMPVEVEKLYSIGVLALSLNGMNRNQPLIDWANANPKSVPDEDAVRHAKDVVVYACSKKVWEQLGSFADLDADGDGTLNVSEVKVAMKKALRRDVSDLDAENLIKAIDTDGSGNVSADEFKKALESHVLNQ